MRSVASRLGVVMRELEGGSAWRTGRRVLWSLGSLLVSTGLFALVGTWSYRLPDASAWKATAEAVAWILLTLEVVTGLVTCYLYWRLHVLVRREHQAGYTTVLWSTDPVEVIDPRTGMTLRRAGDPPLETSADLKRARTAAERRCKNGQ